MKYRYGENERIFFEIRRGRVNNYLWERDIQLSDGGKGKKSRIFLFMQESCNNEAGQNSDSEKR